jgi:phosphohistidine phosphatase
MRRLMLLRHAKAERAGRGGLRDRSRKLTKRGRADISAIGAYMVRYELVPDLAIVSTATRTQETWSLLAACFTNVPSVLMTDRIYDAKLTELASVISGTREAHELLVVGHNPSLHELAMHLIGSGEGEAHRRINENLPTSGLVLIDLRFDDWSLLQQSTGRLERFVSPRLIAKMVD